MLCISFVSKFGEEKLVLLTEFMIFICSLLSSDSRVCARVSLLYSEIYYGYTSL